MTVVTAVIADQALQLVVLLTLLAALLDLVTGVLAAVREHRLSLDMIAGFIGNHILMRVIPTVALASFASVLSAALATYAATEQTAMLSGVAAAAWAAAWAACAAYVAECLDSYGVNLRVAVRGVR